MQTKHQNSRELSTEKALAMNKRRKELKALQPLFVSATPRLNRLRNRVKNWRARYPEKYQVSQIMIVALRKGVLIRPVLCSKCLKRCRPEAHHPDYTKPLEVVWLCKHCHGQAHRRAPKTHCANGHAMTPRNTKLNARGRYCRICLRAQDRARYHAKKTIS